MTCFLNFLWIFEFYRDSLYANSSRISPTCSQTGRIKQFTSPPPQLVLSSFLSFEQPSINDRSTTTTSTTTSTNSSMVAQTVRTMPLIFHSSLISRREVERKVKSLATLPTRSDEEERKSIGGYTIVVVLLLVVIQVLLLLCSRYEEKIPSTLALGPAECEDLYNCLSLERTAFD